MCFSATASFTASAILAIIGLATLAQIQNYKKQLLFALIPLLFAIQQACEGFVWLSFTTHPELEPWRLSAMYGFLFFAFIVWPVWMPMAINMLDENYNQQQSSFGKKLMIFTPLICGIIASSRLLVYLMYYQATISIFNNSLHYTLPITESWSYYFYGLLYSYAAIAPFIFSPRRYILLLGVLLFASYLISYQFYYTCFTSVWCFFAALLSLGIFAIIRDSRN